MARRQDAASPPLTSNTFFHGPGEPRRSAAGSDRVPACPGSVRTVASRGAEIISLRRRLGVVDRPTDFADLSRRLAGCPGEFGATFGSMANYVMKHPHDVAFGTVRSVAAACAVSSTSVVRLALAMGFDGFLDMRDFYRASLRKSPPDVDADVVVVKSLKSGSGM